MPPGGGPTCIKCKYNNCECKVVAPNDAGIDTCDVDNESTDKSTRTRNEGEGGDTDGTTNGAAVCPGGSADGNEERVGKEKKTRCGTPMAEANREEGSYGILLGNAHGGIKSDNTLIKQEITTLAAGLKVDLIAITEVGLTEDAQLPLEGYEASGLAAKPELKGQSHAGVGLWRNGRLTPVSIKQKTDIPGFQAGSGWLSSIEAQINKQRRTS